MKTEVYLALTVLVALWMFVLGGSISKGNPEYIEGEQAVLAIKECEAKLPRNQRCVIVGYDFKIEENK